MKTISFPTRLLLAAALLAGVPALLVAPGASKPAFAESSMDVNSDNDSGVTSELLSDTGDGESSEESNSQETCSDFVDVSSTNSRC